MGGQVSSRVRACVAIMVTMSRGVVSTAKSTVQPSNASLWLFGAWTVAFLDRRAKRHGGREAVEPLDHDLSEQSAVGRSMT